VKGLGFILKDKGFKAAYSEEYMMKQIDGLLARVDAKHLSRLVFMKFITVLSKSNEIFVNVS